MLAMHQPTGQTAQSQQLLQRPEIHAQWELTYLNPHMERFYDLAFGDILRRIHPAPTDSILDAGCGFGYHTLRLARSGAQITAIDFSDIALNAANRRIKEAGLGKQVIVQKADLTRLPFEDDTFKFVISWGVIMHIPEMERALLELVRVLKPGGVLVLCENNVRSPDIAIRERSIHFLKRLTGRPTSQRNRTNRGIEAWAHSEGGGLLVRKTDMRFLTCFLSRNGLHQIARRAGQFTEAYTNMPTQFLKRFVYAINVFYFRWIGIPQLAVSNILYFRK